MILYITFDKDRYSTEREFIKREKEIELGHKIKKGFDLTLSISQLIGRFHASGFNCQLQRDYDPEHGKYLLQVNTGSTRVKQRDDTDFVDPIDMKPFFARSPKAKSTYNHNAGGHWYMKVPVYLKGGTPINPVQKSNKDWLNSIHSGDTVTMNEINSQFVPNPATMTNNQFGQNSNPDNTTSGRVIFRTVSDHSNPNSWVTNNINRQKEIENVNTKHIHITDDNASEDTIADLTPNQKGILTEEAKEDLSNQSFNTGYNPDLAGSSNISSEILNNLQENEESQEDRSVPNTNPRYEQTSLPLFNQPPTR